ncbi:glycosyltransferase family 87 protein [Sphingosinicella terrae]|uniref:glycosyltransferase family 87 protein n=1 Tax=Sphingosinicella terrae TaxID=2172047 RepID=UPI000E0D8A6E|nr:glycosyltransferase family 87 protein [Sphingosinicella terrae]
MGAHSTLLDRNRLVRAARLWCLIAPLLAAAYLARQLTAGWTDGAGHPFGEDFLNFWSGARLSLAGEWTRIYDMAAFHRFETMTVGGPIDFYHYSYPPVTWLLTAPFGALPYPVAWAAWQASGLIAFATAVRRIAPDHWRLIALASPALLINFLGGQNGAWTAAALGWGLILLERKPLLAGAILAAFVIKPQLGWLIPLALLAGRQWRALAGFSGTATLLLGLSWLMFGTEAWIAYAEQGARLKSVILEAGSGTWHRMLSVFVLVRHAGAPLWIAYAAQAAASLAVAALVARLWHARPGEREAKAALVLGALAGSLYVSDYDCVMLTLAACWLWPQADERGRAAIAAAMVVPLLAAPLALSTGLALGAFALWAPLVWLALRSAAPERRGERPQPA